MSDLKSSPLPKNGSIIIRRIAEVTSGRYWYELNRFLCLVSAPVAGLRPCLFAGQSQKSAFDRRRRPEACLEFEGRTKPVRNPAAGKLPKAAAKWMVGA